MFIAACDLSISWINRISICSKPLRADYPQQTTWFHRKNSQIPSKSVLHLSGGHSQYPVYGLALTPALLEASTKSSLFFHRKNARSLILISHDHTLVLYRKILCHDPKIAETWHLMCGRQFRGRYSPQERYKAKCCNVQINTPEFVFL